MKKFFSCIMLVVVFLLVGCDDGQVDLSKNAKVQSQLNKEQFYGAVVHKGVEATDVVVKNVKINETIYAYTIYMKGKTGHGAMVSFICDLRTRDAGVSYVVRDNNDNVPKGDVEISIMQYSPEMTDVYEADENKDPVFSTANGENDFLGGVRKAASLPADTKLAFVIDKPANDGTYMGNAWTPLFTAKQLDKAISKVRDNCDGLKLDLNDAHVVPADGY